jgi:hypothetical protein
MVHTHHFGWRSAAPTSDFVKYSAGRPRGAIDVFSVGRECASVALTSKASASVASSGPSKFGSPSKSTEFSKDESAGGFSPVTPSDSGPAALAQRVGEAQERGVPLSPADAVRWHNADDASPFTGSPRKKTTVLTDSEKRQRKMKALKTSSQCNYRLPTINESFKRWARNMDLL